MYVLVCAVLVSGAGFWKLSSLISGQAMLDWLENDQHAEYVSVVIKKNTDLNGQVTMQ